MKKIISVILVAAMLLSTFAFSSFAATSAKTATFTLKASVHNASSGGHSKDKEAYLATTNKTVYNSANNPTINVRPGQVVWVTIHLKTGSQFYAGDWQGYLFYTNNIFTSSTQGGGVYIWDTNGKYSGVCSHGGSTFSKMYAGSINTTAPTNWSTSKKDQHEYYSFFMYPNHQITTKVQASVDDDLVTFPIYVKSDAKVGSTGTIFFPEEALISRDSTAPEKPFILSSYKNGNILDQNFSDTPEYGVDISKAKLNFKVVSGGTQKGDINSDGQINSNDALLVLQASTGIISLSASQKSVADVNGSGKIDSSDALLILQYATGIIKKF